MKTKIIALGLFAATAGVVTFLPTLQSVAAMQPTPIVLPPINPVANERPKVEVVFVLDTTGSMGGLIQAAKEKIWSIANTMASAQPAPEIRVGLVAYRDRGDSYVTRVVDLSPDLDTMYATLMDFNANGGGDGPESVNQALFEAVNNISWSQDEQAYKVVFLVGDAPPHMDYSDDVKYPQTLAIAKQKGIVVNTIQCGSNTATTKQWQQMASLGNGGYFQVEQAGSAVAVATPFDKDLAELSAKLDATRLYYGNAEEKQKQDRKMQAAKRLNEEASVSSRARRAEFNVKAGKSSNFLGEKELVDDVASGRIDIATIAPAALPEPLQSLAPAEQQAFVAEQAKKRQKLQDEIEALADKRADYVKEELEKSGGAKDSLDSQLFGIVRRQAASKGLEYDEGALSY